MTENGSRKFLCTFRFNSYLKKQLKSMEHVIGTECLRWFLVAQDLSVEKGQ